MLVATTSAGHLAVLDLSRRSVVSVSKPHRGNITSACFANDFEHFATASGAFGRRHDNSVVVYRVFEVLSELFVKKVHAINNAHGRQRGVMCVRASNQAGDRILYSCGYQDDGRVRVWDYLERATVAEAMSSYFNHRDTIYNMHLVKFQPPDSLGEAGESEASRLS